MRKDMPKLLCERERRGHKLFNEQTGRNRRLPIKLEEEDGEVELVARETRKHGTPVRSMRPRGAFEKKSLNENLAPLRRYLTKSIGRRWDTVYAEIRQSNPVGSAVTEHIYEHLKHMVHTNTEKTEDRQILSYAAYRPEILQNNRWTFYVDERGILRKPPGVSEQTQRRRLRIKDGSFRLVRQTRTGQDGFLRGEDGSWWRVRFSWSERTVSHDVNGKPCTNYLCPHAIEHPQSLRAALAHYRSWLSGVYAPHLYLSFAKLASQSEIKGFGLR